MLADSSIEMLLLFRCQREAQQPDVWSPQFRERQIPIVADARELDEFIIRMQALVELRTAPWNEDRANTIVQAMDMEIRNALESPTKHRDWRETRPRVVALLTELGQVLYEEIPPSVN